MALLIGRENINSNDFKFSGDSTAVQKLQELSNHYSLRDGTLKPGTLRLVKNWDGTIQLKRTQWYHFWNSSLFGTRDTSRAETYVKSLIKKAYERTNPFLPEEVQYNKYTTKSNTLNYFLLSKNQKGPVTTENLSKVLSFRHKIDVKISEANKNEYAIKKCLDKEGITLQNRIGAGGMGSVFKATVNRDTIDYVFKSEFQLKYSPISNSEGLPFHRRGDLAASCLKELKHMTKPIFVIVALQKTVSSPAEYHYLPAMEAESFVKEIAQAHPKAQVAIAGQLMELAPGRELYKCIYGKEGDQVSFDPSEKPFKQVMQGLFTHMKIAMENNYLHRDIKAENVMINNNDNKDYEVRFIDGGFAAYGGRGSNELQLENCTGTIIYMSPRVLINGRQHKTTRPYGAEVDFYSTGMLLLEMIDKDSFETIHKKEAGKNFGAFAQSLANDLKTNPPSTKNYLEEYLKSAGANSTVSKKLNENPSVKNLIDLCFEASKGGESGKEAFEQWKTAFQTWKENNRAMLPLT
ncbi:MAG: protein kinase [Chthoniobacterales bacterium]|nr:protein kinase [Chthoniobacterales bacterium]